MKTLRSNSKQVKEQIRQHIVDCVLDDNEKPFDTFEGARDWLLSEFKRVSNNPVNLHNFPNEQDRFSDYLNALPFNFEFYDYDIEQYVNSLGINPTGKKYEPMEITKKYHGLIWREISK